MANYISKHTGKQIDAAVDAFLAGGGSGSAGSVVVDDTLTQAGKAADAKATGDRLTALTEEIGGKHYSLSASQIEKCKEYASRINEATGKTEQFLFFTDPHYGGKYQLSGDTLKGLRQIAEVYNNTPTSMCVSGGDWLNDSNTKENACWQLGVIDGMMKSLFDRYVMLIGNHDTNYQGKEYMESGADGTYDMDEHLKCVLPQNVLRNLWHRRQGESYFIVDGDCTKFYAFDTGLDWYTDMDAYRWEQLDWFASDLLSTNPEHSAALLHIAGLSASAPTPFIENITQISKAYNTRKSVTLNGKTYDFSAATGKFNFLLGGHRHKDSVYVCNDTVIVLTTNLRAVSSVLTFDLVLVDYAAEKIHMVRVGSGNSRAISLVDGSVTDGESGNGGGTGGEEEPDDGAFDGENMFTYGVRTDYFNVNGTAVSDSTSPSFSVNASELYARCKDASGKAAVFTKNDKFTNDGSTFELMGNFVNETEGNTATARFHCKMYNSAGEVYTGAATGWTYGDYYKSHFADADRIVFKLPDDVREFQIGFLFDSVENNKDFIRVYNVSLKKK